MQAPKKKSSKSRRDMRRSHHALVPVRIGNCLNCEEPVRSHCVCVSCGYYKGKFVLPAKKSAKNTAQVAA